MKTVSIGRGEGCNIIVDDEMMSRSHAIIRIPTFGKMEVVDMSKNGTYVNGVRVRPNVPVPVTRKDVVNFAEVYQLDWSTIPDPLKYYKIGAIIVGGLIVLLLVILLFKSLSSGTDTSPEQPAVEQVQKPIQTDYEQPSQTKQEEETQPETPIESDEVRRNVRQRNVLVSKRLKHNKKRRNNSNPSLRIVSLLKINHLMVIRIKQS